VLESSEWLIEQRASVFGTSLFAYGAENGSRSSAQGPTLSPLEQRARRYLLMSIAGAVTANEPNAAFSWLN